MAYQVFAVTPATNSDDRCDATGAFIPGAQRFAMAYKGSFKTFDNVGSHAKRNFLQTIKDGPGSLDIFSYFGHGYKTQLGSAKIYTDQDIEDFAAVLREKLKGDAVVVLYACWAGIEGGFSTKLQGKLGPGVWVYGHTTLGHSYANPDVSEVQQSRSPRFRRLFAGSDLKAAWAESLRHTDMWLRFPIMWDVYIERELNAIRLLGKWKVPGPRTYVFEWAKANGTYGSLDSLNQDPEGTVQDETGGRKGTWTIEEELKISWESRESEKWSMPLKPLAQSIFGVPGFATRLSHTLAGKSQI
jgi:hypothetical protein